jgi:hypothetical protein
MVCFGARLIGRCVTGAGSRRVCFASTSLSTRSPRARDLVSRCGFTLRNIICTYLLRKRSGCLCFFCEPSLWLPLLLLRAVAVWTVFKRVVLGETLHEQSQGARCESGVPLFTKLQESSGDCPR